MMFVAPAKAKTGVHMPMPVLVAAMFVSAVLVCMPMH
jgi:hypothetical protein